MGSNPIVSTIFSLNLSFRRKKARWFFSDKSRKTIAQKLEGDGFKIIKRDKDYESWDILVEAYRDQKMGAKWNRNSRIISRQEIEDKLKKKRDRLLGLEYDENRADHYEKAKKWCVVPRTVKDRALSLGFKFLNMDEKSSEDRDIWELRIQYYQKYDDEIDLSGIADSDESTEKSRMNEKIRLMKKAAKSIVQKMNFEEDGDLAWNTAMRWFIKERP